MIDCFAADLDMNSQSTGLLTRDLVKKYAADVKAMAQRGYLLEANIVLTSAAGDVIRAAKYEVTTNASTLTASAPETICGRDAGRRTEHSCAVQPKME